MAADKLHVRSSACTDALVPTRCTQKPRVGFDSTLSRRRGDNVVRSNILIIPLS